MNGVQGWLVDAVEIGLGLACALSVPSVVYCLLMLGAARQQKRAVRPSVDGAAERTRFRILIPAHDEKLVIAGSLAAVRAQDYPKSLFGCTVIADNCSDETATLARAVDGIEVIERSDDARRGKGFALNAALAQILPSRDFDAVVIVDADTLMRSDFLTAMDRAIRSCAPDDRERFVGQGLYEVHNVEDGWRTALMAGALSLVHCVRPLARERWSVSAGLKGNGMCFAAGILDELQWPGESITEDLDYGIDLIERLGVRVRFVPDAVVAAQMPSDADVAARQRRRWEGGRLAAIRRRAWPLLRDGVIRGDRLRLDAALDLLCPPLAQQALLFVVWAALVLCAFAVKAPSPANWLCAWAAGAIGLAVYVVVGFKVAGAPRAAYRALLMAVLFVPWKLVSVIAGRGSSGWRRTDRRVL
jgi:cellulose synthase/poly-beta-1,6-N-acetylglucosamine synthase-like glycosyltransferase